MGYLTLDQAAARIIHRISREPVKLRTLQRWIQQHADVVDKRFIKGKRQTHYLEEDDLAALVRYYPQYELLPPNSALSPLISLSLTVAKIEDDMKDLRAKILKTLADGRETASPGSGDVPTLMSPELLNALLSDPSAPSSEQPWQESPSAKQASTSSNVGTRKTEKKQGLTEEEIDGVRHQWVGRGETYGRFALFIYCQIAHGYKYATAGTQCSTAKKVLAAGGVPRFQVTAVRFDEARDTWNLVTEEQAIVNINQAHREACDKARSDTVPESVLCYDPHCPVCSVLVRTAEGHIRRWTIGDILTPELLTTGNGIPSTEEGE